MSYTVSNYKTNSNAAPNSRSVCDKCMDETPVHIIVKAGEPIPQYDIATCESCMNQEKISYKNNKNYNYDHVITSNTIITTVTCTECGWERDVFANPSRNNSIPDTFIDVCDICNKNA